jgi:outer membrane beta-barrel protein
MESRIRLFLLTVAMATALPGCALLGLGRDSGETPEAAAPSPGEQPVIQPEVARREVATPRIETENFEIGAFAGILGIEDFGTNSVYGVRLAYHITEDFFIEGAVGQSRAGKTSYESLSGSAPLLVDSERDYRYYTLSAGWNALPGEIFIGRNRAYNTALYLIGGVGSTRFGGDDLFSINAGVGYRLLLTDWTAIHLDFRDHLFDTDLLGTNKTSHNLETHLGLTVFF